jgi:hypothetical protein
MTYTVQTIASGPDWPEDPRLRFKYRHESKEGFPCAQLFFDARRDAGQYARLVGWMDGKPTVLDEAPGAGG